MHGLDSGDADPGAPERLADALHKSGEDVAVESEWAARRLFATNSPTIGNKTMRQEIVPSN